MQTTSNKCNFHTLVVDSEALDVSTAETYVASHIRAKWNSGVWTIAGHPLVEISSDAVETLAEPVFQVCQIRNGQLKVAQSAVTAFSGTSTLLRARLLHEAQKSDAEFNAASLTIGAGGEPPSVRPRTSTSAGPASDSSAPAEAIELAGEKTVRGLLLIAATCIMQFMP